MITRNQVWCKVRVESEDIAIGVCVCYHSTSPTNEEEINLHRKIEEVCEKFDQVLICEDFNHITIDWELLHSGQEGLVRFG